MKKEILLFSMLALALFAGCSSDNGTETTLVNPSVDPSVLLPLSVTSASLSEAKAVTRTDFTSLESGEIGVSRAADNGYDVLNNVKFTYGTPWTTATPVKVGGAEAKVCAYYPYNASIMNSAAVPLKSQVYSTAADLCYATSVAVKNTAREVNFNMYRAYSEITFKISRTTSYEGSSLCKVENISIANAGIKTDATIDISTGNYGTGTLGTVTFAPGIDAITPATPKSGCVLMVPVAGLTGDITFTFVVDGTSMAKTVDAATFGLTELAKAKNYQINVTISGKDLIINSVNLEDWTDQIISTIIDLK